MCASPREISDNERLLALVGPKPNPQAERLPAPPSSPNPYGTISRTTQHNTTHMIHELYMYNKWRVENVPLLAYPACRVALGTSM